MDKHARNGLVGGIQFISHSLAGATRWPNVPNFTLTTHQTPPGLHPPPPPRAHRSFTKSVFGQDAVQRSHAHYFLDPSCFQSYSIFFRILVSIDFTDPFTTLLISIFRAREQHPFRLLSSRSWRQPKQICVWDCKAARRSRSLQLLHSTASYTYHTLLNSLHHLHLILLYHMNFVDGDCQLR